MEDLSPDYVGNHPRATRELAEWLERETPSAVIDPALPIVDAHHHLYGASGDRSYYELADLRSDLDTGHKIVGTVYVEAYESGWRTAGPDAMRPVGEVEKIIGLTRDPIRLATGSCQVAAGIVAHADMSLGDRVVDVLDAETAAAEGRLRGIRHRTATIDGAVGRATKDPPRPHLLLDRGFQRGVAHLGARGLTFDVWAYHTQLDELLTFADAVPDTTMVVDHVGGPIGVAEFRAKRAEVLRAWESGLRALAERASIRVKLGGMGMPLYGFDLHRADGPADPTVLADAWRRLIETTIDIFGPERCMLESNFPVDKQSTGYRNLWNAYKILARGFTPDEKTALFYGTACDVYRLPALRETCIATM